MRASWGVRAIAGLAAGLALLTAEVRYAGSAPCTAPPAPDSTKRTVPDGHAKASSYAPQRGARNHAYGTPIQRPILSKHKRTKRRADKSAPR